MVAQTCESEQQTLAASLAMPKRGPGLSAEKAKTELAEPSGYQCSFINEARVAP